ncbi:glycine-rich domain-containing protein [Pseudomonas reidholzensis]
MATQRWDSLIGSINPLSFVRTKNTAGAWSAWELVVTDRHLPYRAKVYYRSAGVYQWTVPAGVYKVDVEVRGAGGSGGFGSQETGSGGGGGGGISKRLCTVVPGSVITITVGAGGAAVSTVGASGNSGTASAFGTFCSATGGSGGSSGSGATGGFGAGGDINMSLGAGNPALRNAPSTYALGGAGGGGESIFATSNSTTPSQPGMGGGGRTSNQSQPGADGCVFITY